MAIGTAYIKIMPEAKGISGEIAGVTDPAAESAGRSSLLPGQDVQHPQLRSGSYRRRSCYRSYSGRYAALKRCTRILRIR